MGYTFIAADAPESIDGDPLTPAEQALWLTAYEKGYRTAHCQTEGEAFGPADSQRASRVRGHGFARGVFDFDQELGDVFDYGTNVPWDD